MRIFNKELNEQKKQQAREAMMEAARNGDAEALIKAEEPLMEAIMESLMADYNARSCERDDSRILSERGVRQLTSAERSYYQKVIDAMKSLNPKQAITDLDVAMPTTVIESVFEDLRQNHPLLSRITFQPTNGLIDIITSDDPTQLAVWGPLCGDITKELQAAFKKLSTSLYKLSAFIPVCKAMLDLGPAWLDRYVRELLSEALACGLESGIISGDGADQPVGMIRQVGDGVSVTNGKYPEKTAVKVSDLTPATIGNLLSILAMGPNGKSRTVDGIVFLVNGQDYYQKVMPATTLMAPDGSYRNDVMPYPMAVIPTFALPRGKAVIGMARRYFAASGMAKEGRIEYSDEYHFLEDERVYLIKLYANGMPLDNNAFLVLDITDLKPLTWKVTQVEETAKSTDATLASLSLGSATLSPVFDAATTIYTASTANNTNTVTAIPTSAGSRIDVTVNDEPLDNGSSAAWKDGSNTVRITVTAEDGAATKTYTVTVTKS